MSHHHSNTLRNGPEPEHLAFYDSTLHASSTGGTTATDTTANGSAPADYLISPAVSLAAGFYYLAFSTDTPGDDYFSPLSSKYGGNIANAGESASTYNYFVGSNSSTTTGGTTTTFPSTCGTRTAIATGGSSGFPMVTIH